MMQLKHRPWKLASLVVFGTIAIVVFGMDLVDGHVSLRRYGGVDAATMPIRFALVVIGYLSAGVTTGVGWIAVVGEWNMDYRSRLKPDLIDPDRTRPL